MFERSDGLMRGSREQRMQEVFGLHESDWDFHTLLGIIQGFLDHAEDVRLAAMDTLLEIARQKKAPVNLSPLSVIEYFMFSFTASSMATKKIFRFLIENTDIPGANQAIERALLGDVRNEDFEKFIDIILEAKKFEFLKSLEHRKLSKRKTQILKNALKNVNGKTKEKLTPKQKAAKKKQQEEYVTVFMNGKQKRIKRLPKIDGIDVEEFIRRNADPIWLHQNEMWEYIDQNEDEDDAVDKMLST